MNIEVGQKALITTDGWFTAPDGKLYRAAFGTVRGVFGDTETLGIKTNARSANWYVEIGSLTVAGCQIHFAIRCDEFNPDPITELRTDEKGDLIKHQAPSSIFNADA